MVLRFEIVRQGSLKVFSKQLEKVLLKSNLASLTEPITPTMCQFFITVSAFFLILGCTLQIFAILVGVLARFCLDFFILKLISSKMFDHLQNRSVSFIIASYVSYEISCDHSNSLLNVEKMSFHWVFHV